MTEGITPKCNCSIWDCIALLVPKRSCAPPRAWLRPGGQRPRRVPRAPVTQEGIEILNFLIEFLDKSRKFHDFFFQNFAYVLTFSMNLDIFEHVRENPTKIHLNFDEKSHS